MEQMEQRVSRLETTMLVVGGVAIALGLGGAGLWTKLDGMKTQASGLSARVSALQSKANDIEALTGNVEKRVNAVMVGAEATAKARLVSYVNAQREVLLPGAIRSGDAVALRFRESRVYIGAARGHGEVNTGKLDQPPGMAPGSFERNAANADEVFVIERQKAVVAESR
jgi:hypothetical protein